LILLDIRMPEMDGYEVCRQLKLDPITAEIPVIFVSALQDTEDKLTAFKSGGVDYITKPFQLEEVLARVDTHVRLHQIQRDLQILVDERTYALTASLFTLNENQKRYSHILEQTIQALALTIEKRDPYTAGHQSRVSKLAVSIAQEMKLTDDFIEGLRLGGMVHDIGKIYIPAEILNRSGRLSEIEFQLIKTHPQVGYDIMKDVEFPWLVAEMIYQHHERLDGSGYPRGLKGDEILLEARILTVADVLEAMASHRPYRLAVGIEKGLEEIQRGAGSCYDAAVVAACLRLFENGENQLAEVADEPLSNELLL
jgi:putative two-component system response regulator